MHAKTNTPSRREFLAQAAASLAGESKRLIIDTHLEVWTLDPKFPFHHPEHPENKPEISAPIENQVEVMREFGLRYAVLINPRYYGWDNSYISYSLHKYPDKFVAHGHAFFAGTCGMADAPNRARAGCTFIPGVR